MSEYAELKSNVLSPSFKWFGHIEAFFEVVKLTGYPFFQFNGKVYKVVNHPSFPAYPIYQDTGKMIEDFE